MIIAKVHNLYKEQAELLKIKLEEFFVGENVLVINENVSIEFYDEGKKRCPYCGRLNSDSAKECASCGAIL